MFLQSGTQLNCRSLWLSYRFHYLNTHKLSLIRIQLILVYVSKKDTLHQWLSEQPMFHDPVYAENIQKKEMDSPFIKNFRCPPLYMP